LSWAVSTAPWSGRTRPPRARKKKEDETPEESRQRQALGVSRGGLSTKIHVLCEGAGKPMAVTLTPGQAHEATQAAALLDQVKVKGKPGRPRQRFEAVAGDKGYDSQAIRDDLRERGSEPVIAHRQDRDGQYPERAAGFDTKKYRRRNVVERLIGRLKEFRGIAMRYAKLAEGFIGLIRLAFMRIWMKDLLSDRA
jgi:transposase